MKKLKKKKVKKDCMLQPRRELNNKQKQITEGMISFWTEERLNVLASVLLQKSVVKLSLIEWLCTHFCKEKRIEYKLRPNDPIEFHLYNSYQNCLNRYSGIGIAAYARHDRVMIEYVSESSPMPIVHKNNKSIAWDSKYLTGARYKDGTKYNYIVTSIGQLKFFHWAMENKVFDYCLNNAKDINAHMKNTRDLKAKEIQRNKKNSSLHEHKSITGKNHQPVKRRKKMSTPKCQEPVCSVKIVTLKVADNTGDGLPFSIMEC